MATSARVGPMSCGHGGSGAAVAAHNERSPVCSVFNHPPKVANQPAA
jgi:hypothetical protein